MVQATSPKSPNSSTMKEQLQASASQFWSSMKTLEQTMKRPVVSPDSTTNDEQEGVQASLESVIRVMFGSCTTGNVTPSSSPTSGGANIGSPSSSREKSRSTCEPASPTRHEESMYTKLFSDNQLRAEEAVCHLREQLESMREPRSPSRRLANHSGKDVPCLFPASSPKHVSSLVTDPPQPPPTHPAHIKNIVSNDISFDDGVSAISQDTLEQMARVYPGESEFLERVHSDVTQDPVDTPDESWMHTVNPNRQGSPFRQGQRISSPLRFTRQGRSGEGTINTKHSRQTIGTKSTMSTQTHEFASAFRKDEQKFWQDVVNEQDEREDPADGSIGISSRHEKLIRARELRRIREMKARRGGTVTTVNSSLYSGPRAQEKVLNATRSDPDRLKEVLIMPPGTEMAEI